MAKVWIMGAGGFGVALAVMCANNGHQVTAYSPFQEEIETLQRDREHKKLLPGVPLPDNISLTWELPERIEADLVILATPSFAVSTSSQALSGKLDRNTIVSCVAKGFHKDTLETMTEIIAKELPSNPIVAISGPSHAEEVGRGVPTTVVAASRNRKAAELIQDTLMCPTLRIYVNDDITGVELGGALKNVIALAVGVAHGLNIGDNAVAALMTRGITEIARLGVAMGAKSETFAGLSGIGDLIVTCTSMHSRNHRAGILIGQGKSAKEAVAAIGMTVEGYTATECAYKLAQKYNVEMPITEQVYQVLYHDKKPQDAIHDLMERPKRHESEYIWLLNR